MLPWEATPPDALELTAMEGRRLLMLEAEVGRAKDLALRHTPLKNVSCCLTLLLPPPEVVL